MWPENWPIFELFSHLDTQWRAGINGVSGLDYAALYPLIDRRFPGEFDETFADIRAMERIALEAMREEN